MATKIITKNSSTTTAIPTAGDLVQGELAVNVTDKRLFTENSVGAIVELGTSPSTIDINAGTIDGTVIGGTTAAAGSFTTLTATGSTTIDGGAGNAFLVTTTTGAQGSGVSSTVSGQVWLYGANWGATDGRFAVYDNTAGAERFSIAKTTGAATFSSDVGIGTSLPSGKLHVKTSTDKNIYLTDAVGETSNAITFQSTNDLGSALTPMGFRASAFTLATGNVGIGVTPNGGWNTSYKALQVGVSGALWSNTSSASLLLSNNTVLNTNGSRYRLATGPVAELNLNNGKIIFSSSATSAAADSVITDMTTKMTLDESGNLLVGTTATHGLNGAGAGTFVTGLSDGQLFLRHLSTAAGKGFYVGADASNVMQVYNQAGVGVTMADGATAWSATSDERLKDIIEPITGGLAKVRRLRSVVGKYKSDEDGVRRAFLIAQDVLAEQPEAVDQTNPDALSLRLTEVIPLLVSALHDASDKIDALTARLEALEGA